MAPARASMVVLLCLALSGCYVKLYGHQSSGGGTTTTAAAGQVSGSAKFSGGKVAFSAGRVPPAGAPGGHLSLGKGATAVLVLGWVVADFVNYIRGEPRPKPLAPDARIADTCSCYKDPVISE
ncbi:MAG: hypothetical protein HYY78_21295 [Betaproteobacteria bacterium]|nr:hypothetical protein [Betaproteobacteria bacterium]